MADELVKKRITEYGTEVAVDELDNSDVIFVDSTQHGTRKLRLKGIRDIISGIQNESIKSSGVSVTADNYAATITNVNDQPVNTIYAYAAGLQLSVTNLPSNNALNIMHYTYKYSVATNVGQVQIAIERSGEKPAMYFRTTSGTPVTWGNWVKMANNADIEAIREELDNLDIETDATLSISGKPADAKATGDAIDDVKADLTQYKNSEISPLPLIPNEYIKTDGTVDTYNTWARTDYIDIGFCERLSVKSTVYSQYNSFYDANKDPISPFNIILQSSSAIVTVPNGAKYMRLSNTAAGMENLVIKFYTANDSIISDLSNTAVTGSGAFVVSSEPTISDADDADANTIHAIPKSNAVLHTPAGNVLGNLLTFGYAKGATVNKSQLMLRNDGKSIYYRSYWNESDGYSDWQVVSGGEIIVAPGGAGDFDSLTDAIANGIQKPNSIVRIKPGVYDIVSELTQDYMDTHEFTATDRGIELKNGIHLVFDSGAFVVCNYSGANATVHKFFSVFNVSGSCEVENLNLVASNLRYAIHDENGGNNVPYRVVWRGCSITFDNSQNPDWLSKKIIGGGLGKYADILIENCYFNPRNIDSAGIPNGCITYHNNSAEGSKSHVVIKNCYFEKSTFSIRWYGNSTEITDCICCGNSFTAEPTCIAETASAPYENVVMYAWNNELRNQN